MAKKPKKEAKKNQQSIKKDKEIESVFKNSTNLKQFKKHIKEADRYEIQRLRSIILEEKKKTEQLENEQLSVNQSRGEIIIVPESSEDE